MQRHVLFLTSENQHEHVIALVQGAILEGQAQPWMYEVLAVSMEAAQYPPEEIERVILSVADFGNTNFESMMYSGSYLRNLGHPAAAVKMYREAANLSPERPEPYVMSMKLASKNDSTADAVWAACGVLRNAWGLDHIELHEEAENLLAETERRLKKSKRPEEIATLETQASDARLRDLKIQIQWNGAGDLDLSVEDPAGGISSFETRESVGGGHLLNDGFGPAPGNCHEDYICPMGFSGEYVIKIKKANGKIVGNRVILTIITHLGSREEKKLTKTIQLNESNEHVQRLTLEQGRRAQRRVTGFVDPAATARDWERTANLAGRPAKRKIKPEARQAVAELRQDRKQTGTRPGTNGRQPVGTQPGVNGAIGFAPVIGIIPEGASFAATAVVSADRRYVRLALSPTFNQLVDVAVFSFQGGAAGAGGGNNGTTR